MPAPMPPETILVDTTELYCDGTTAAAPGSLGHPRVFLIMNRDGFVDCPYCDRHFVLAANADARRAGH